MPICKILSRFRAAIPVYVPIIVQEANIRVIYKFRYDYTK